MNEDMYSPLLLEVLAAAKKIGNLEENPITVERFILALSQVLPAEEPEEEGELKGAVSLYRRYFRNHEMMKVALQAYIETPDPLAILDDLVMEKLLVCLDVFSDVGLIRLHRFHKYIRIELVPNTGKADLNQSKTMQILLQAKES